MKKRVGILTSGGDCPGLNATIRGVAKALYARMGDNVEIVGIANGYSGLINGDYREMNEDDFRGILTLGGTILGTKRTPFKLLRVVEDEFKSHDFGSAKDLLLHDLPAERATVLYDVNEKQILERLKAIIEVKEKSETTVPITQEHIDKVKKYLLMLDLIVNCPERYESGKQAEHFVFSQPGMRYAIAKALVYSLMQDAYFASISEADKAYITGKILDDVKGRMLEDIVLLEVRKTAPSTMEVFKFKFDAGGEFDMVIYDKTNQNCRIYEIKHSTEANEKQTLHLRDAEKCQIVEKRFGPISGKFVLYRGKDTFAEGVQYLNVENFLCGLK